ncbi:MAG: hypothetical protein KGS45_12785 [Planctomycetes bacterium]|nr:hypothetical protein [Planctomycetota bacterium]
MPPLRVHSLGRLLLRHGFFYALALSALGAAVAICVTCLTSQVMTDRTLITQFLFWIPLWAYAVLLLVVLLLSAALLIISFLLRRARLPLHEWNASDVAHRRLVAVLSMLLLIAFGLGAVGWLRQRTPSSLTPVEAANAEVRILHWNLSSPDTHTWPGVITDVPECRHADVLLLGVTMDDAQFTRVMKPLAQSHHIRRIGTLAVLSRFPISDVRTIDLKLDSIVNATRRDGSSPEAWYQTLYNDHAEKLGISRREFGLPDPGDIIAFTLTTPSGQVPIQFIDLPSSPLASRHAIALATAERIRDAVLPAPQLIIGDFNIPAASQSLSAIAPGYRLAARHAHDADSGPTWPRARPLLQIDHALVHPSITTRVYRTFDPGFSDHWGQFLIFTPVKSSPSESVVPPG